MLVCPKNKIIVTIEKKYDDEIVFDSGVVLYKDTSYHPEQHVTIMGTVVSIPHKLSNSADNLFIGSQIVPEVQAGDKICFNYQVIGSFELKGQTKAYNNLIKHEDKEYWMVDYFQVFFVVRDGEIIPVGSTVIVEPIKEFQEIQIGRIIIPESVLAEESKDKGVLKHIGTPLKDRPVLDVTIGDTVHFISKYAARYPFEGSEHIFLRQDDLTGKE